MTSHELWVWVSRWGYPALFVGTLVEGTGFPGPVEVLFFAAGFLVAEGRMSLPFVVLSSMVGMFIGNLIGYAVGRYGGRPFVERYGHYMGLPPEGLGRAQVWFDRYGGLTVAVSRIIGVTRTPSIVAAGVLRLRMVSYALWSLVGDTAFIVFWALVGTFLGNRWLAWKAAHPDLVYAFGAFVVIAIIGGVFISKYLLERLTRVGPQPRKETDDG